MQKLLECANEYIRTSDWKTLAVLKLCLCAVGVTIGVLLPKRAKKPALIIAVSVFAATYIPLIVKLFKIIFRKRGEEI